VEGRLRGGASLRVSADGSGGLCYDELSSSPLLCLRPTSDAVYMVSGAATPLGGDVLDLHVEVGRGAALTVRSAAAAVARKGPSDQPSLFRIEARVAAGGSLAWAPEPTVVAFESRHSACARIELAESSELSWREEVVLGRAGEAPGSWASLIVVTVADRPVLRQRLSLGPGAPGWDGAAIASGARALACTVFIGARLVGACDRGTEPPTAVRQAKRVVGDDQGYAVAMPLAQCTGTVVTSLATSHRHARRLAELVCASGDPALR
jgi:urease accessory protein